MDRFEVVYSHKKHGYFIKDNLLVNWEDYLINLNDACHMLNADVVEAKKVIAENQKLKRKVEDCDHDMEFYEQKVYDFCMKFYDCFDLYAIDYIESELGIKMEDQDDG